MCLLCNFFNITQIKSQVAIIHLWWKLFQLGVVYVSRRSTVDDCICSTHEYTFLRIPLNASFKWEEEVDDFHLIFIVPLQHLLVWAQEEKRGETMRENPFYTRVIYHFFEI
jgi:hypothetical protein